MIDKRRPILVKKDFCIHQVFERQAAKTPGAIALTLPKTPSTTSTTAQQNEQLTYIELEQRANQLAQYLRKKGVGPEILVGICMERSLEMIVAILGVLKAGGAYVPLDLAYPKERLAFILEDTQMPLLLTQIDLVEKLPTLSTVKMLFLDSLSEAITQEKATPPVTETTPENLAYAIYTSGSTGKPKGVLISHQNVTRLITTMYGHCSTRMRLIFQFGRFGALCSTVVAW
jgi:non-ribosomal peptide synthetase component F